MTAAPLTPRRVLLHAALFVATLFTTTAHGALYVHGGSIFPLADGLPYSIPLMTILVCHELGHYFAARLHGVPATLPFFVPLPPQVGLGTLGALIMQGETADRRKLIDIGAAGPLAGLVVAIPVLAYGLAQSEVRGLAGMGMQEGNSILYAALKYAVKGEWLPHDGRDVMLHPTALAGWAGLLVTMLNLLPIGQLDGGHIATAYFGNRYARVSRAIHRAMPVLAIVTIAWVYGVVRDEVARAGVVVDPWTVLTFAVMGGAQWLIWFGVLALLRRMTRGVDHPPVDDQPLPPSRRRLFWVVVVAFALIFMPVPLRWALGSADVPDGGTPAALP